jgi:hypothetical protein
VAYNGGTNNFGSTIKYLATKAIAAPAIVQTSTSASNCSATTNNASTGNDRESFLSYRVSSGAGASQYSENWTATAEL